MEHDVPLEYKPVQLEPTATPTGSVPGQHMEHDEQEPDRKEREPDTEEQHSTLAGLTGFLSGFAAAVQTTVGCPGNEDRLLKVMLLCCRAKIWWLEV